ncbi:TPA: hypothetical protein HA251_04040 [Candidatus Woesearchaeota archaeon]|nr:hypothetical protein [Candidatus Woesearchaeota archaeon]
MNLTEQNWKEHRIAQARQKFSIGDVVAYDISFGGFGGSIAFGRVQRITPAATVELELGELHLLNVESPTPGYAAFWYDPKVFTPTSRSDHQGGTIATLPFYARFDAREKLINKRWTPDNRIIWQSAERSIAHGGSLHLLDGSDTYYGLHVDIDGVVKTEEYYR